MLGDNTNWDKVKVKEILSDCCKASIEFHNATARCVNCGGIT